VPSFGADRIFNGLPARGERRLELAPQRGRRRTVFPRPVQQPGDECRMDVGRK
jgi:hypothetical protein